MSIDTQGLTLQDTAMVEKLAKANAMLRELKPRKGAFETMDAMYLTVVGAMIETRMEVEIKRETMFAKTEGWADEDINGYDEVIIGAGPSAAAWASTAVLSGRPRPLVVGDTLGGKSFAMTVNPWFRLNSRNRPGEAGLSSEQAALNVIPGSPIQGENLNMDEYQTNSDLAYVIRTALLRFADLRKAVAQRVNFSRSSRSQRRYEVVLEDGKVYADRVIDARGLGMPRRPRSEGSVDYGPQQFGERVWSVYDFAKRFEQPFPFRDLDRVAVIGGGDSGKVVVEALLGIGPNRHMSVPMLDWIEQVDWYGQGLQDDCLSWQSAQRTRYADIGSFLRKPSEGRARLRVFEQLGYVDEAMDKVYVGGRPYDAVIVATGFDRMEPLPGAFADYGDTLLYAADGRTQLGRIGSGGDGLYQVGVVSRLGFDNGDPFTTQRIDNNQVALFRNLPRIVRLSAKMDAIKPELVVESAKEQRAATKARAKTVVGTDRKGEQIRLGDRVTKYGYNGSVDWRGDVVKSNVIGYPFAVLRDDGMTGGNPVDLAWIVDDSDILEIEVDILRRTVRRSKTSRLPKPIIGYDTDGKPLREGDRVRLIEYGAGVETEGTVIETDGGEGFAIDRDDGTAGDGPYGSWLPEDEDEVYRL